MEPTNSRCAAAIEDVLSAAHPFLQLTALEEIFVSLLAPRPEREGRALWEWEISGSSCVYPTVVLLRALLASRQSLSHLSICLPDEYHNPFRTRLDECNGKGLSSILEQVLPSSQRHTGPVANKRCFAVGLRHRHPVFYARTSVSCKPASQTG